MKHALPNTLPVFETRQGLGNFPNQKNESRRTSTGWPALRLAMWLHLIN